MLFGYSVTQNAGEAAEELPNNEAEFFNAKTFLQTASGNTGDNLYDHLTEVLNRILAERPENVIDFFEEYSRKVKERRYRPLTDRLEDCYITPAAFELASHMLRALRPLPAPAPSTLDPEDLELADMSRNNLLEMLFYLEQAGLGLPRPEMVFVMLSMRQLVAAKPIASIRFWGKVLGTFQNYLVLEAELKEEEYVRRNEEFAEQTAQLPSAPMSQLDEALAHLSLAGEGATSKVPRALPAEPQIHFLPPAEAPMEPSGVGLNKKAYFVCPGIGEPWTELPDVSPQQIRVARQIHKAFSGRLDTPIQTHPEFPGQERHLLRAQIARISSATLVAPLGFYTFGAEELGEGAEEEEEEAAGGEPKTVYSPNPHYQPPALKDLLDSSMSFWVHTAPYILPQGRTSWWNPGPDLEGAGDEEDEGEQLGEEEQEEEPKATRVEPESGPPLLTPLSEDASLETTNPWTVRPTASVLDMFSLAVVRSNLWPGGHALATPTSGFYNVYIGDGLKYMQTNFTPLPLPAVQQEYPVGPEVLEVLDPSGQEEEQWRIDHLPKPKPQLGEGGEEAEPEQEEEEEDEEEDDED
uniref:Radial spoke head protein 6 homolog A n=1 Tax=Dendroctonus ponderosae TaxID=77166 RepID=A0AAR5P3I9_DENPD